MVEAAGGLEVEAAAVRVVADKVEEVAVVVPVAVGAAEIANSLFAHGASEWRPVFLFC